MLLHPTMRTFTSNTIRVLVLLLVIIGVLVGQVIGTPENIQTVSTRTLFQRLFERVLTHREYTPDYTESNAPGRANSFRRVQLVSASSDGAALTCEQALQETLDAFVDLSRQTGTALHVSSAEPTYDLFADLPTPAATSAHTHNSLCSDFSSKKKPPSNGDVLLRHYYGLDTTHPLCLAPTKQHQQPLPQPQQKSCRHSRSRQLSTMLVYCALVPSADRPSGSAEQYKCTTAIQFSSLIWKLQMPTAGVLAQMMTGALIRSPGTSAELQRNGGFRLALTMTLKMSLDAAFRPVRNDYPLGLLPALEDALSLTLRATSLASQQLSSVADTLAQQLVTRLTSTLSPIRTSAFLLMSAMASASIAVPPPTGTIRTPDLFIKLANALRHTEPPQSRLTAQFLRLPTTAESTQQSSQFLTRLATELDPDPPYGHTADFLQTLSFALSRLIHPNNPEYQSLMNAELTEEQLARVHIHDHLLVLTPELSPEFLVAYSVSLARRFTLSPALVNALASTMSNTIESALAAASYIYLPPHLTLVNTGAHGAVYSRIHKLAPFFTVLRTKLSQKLSRAFSSQRHFREVQALSYEPPPPPPSDSPIITEAELRAEEARYAALQGKTSPRVAKAA